MFENIKPLKLDSSKQGIWFTSDLHFGHQNIIKFCNRPWKTVEEMNEGLIANWNSVVKDDDIVFDLGDFAFAPNSKWKEILSRLNGIHYLILGNHAKYRHLFEEWVRNITTSQIEGFNKQMYNKENNVLGLW